MFGLHVGVGTFAAEAGWAPVKKIVGLVAIALSVDLGLAITIACSQPDGLPERLKFALSRTFELVQQMAVSLPLG